MRAHAFTLHRVLTYIWIQGYYTFEAVNSRGRYISRDGLRLDLTGVNDARNDNFKASVSWRFIDSKYIQSVVEFTRFLCHLTSKFASCSKRTC